MKLTETSKFNFGGVVLIVTFTFYCTLCLCFLRLQLNVSRYSRPKLTQPCQLSIYLINLPDFCKFPLTMIMVK
jgi:hypothetical protein